MFNLAFFCICFVAAVLILSHSVFCMNGVYIFNLLFLISLGYGSSSAFPGCQG